MSRLIFDAQVLQTPAWYRGMGKYSLELIRSMAAQNIISQRWDTIDIIISSDMDIDSSLLTELTALPAAKLHRLDLLPNDIINPAVTSTHNRGVIDAFMVGKGDDTSFIILSLMQGEISPTFPSTNKVHKSVLFYDLIPLMFHKTYLQNPITRKEYLSKLSELFKADTYLAISKTVANDLSVYLGISPSRIVSIDGGPIAHDTKTKSFTVSRPFVLMPTGNDLRKNNRRGVEGFNLFNKQHDNKYTLVITSFFKDEQIEELSKLSNNLVFTGNIPGAQLNYLYKETAAVLFPSEYEGLGLPVLEALENSVPVACSDITVFREISSTAFAFFNPTNTHGIADALEYATTHRLPKREGEKILARYSWGKTASVTEEVVAREHGMVGHKPKLVIVGTDFAGKSSVGKMILQSHASLCRLFDVAYYESLSQSGIEQRINFTSYISDVRELAESKPLFTEYTDRVPVYHMTNKKSSSRIAFGLLARPGIVLLHDLDMRVVWDELKIRGLISPERYRLEKQINDRFGVKSTHWLGSLLANQHAVVVFSKKAEKLIKILAENMDRRIYIIRLSLPVNNLVYSDITPPHKGPAVQAEAIEAVDDMQYETFISRLEQPKASPGLTSTEALLPIREAAKYSRTDMSGYEVFANELGKLVIQLSTEDSR